MKNLHHIYITSALAAAITLPQAAAQNQWPNKPIRMTVSSGAGGGLDFVSRLIATPLTEALGQSVVVDNRAGASGSIAADVTAHSAPDGYTVMMLSASLVVYGIVAKTPYDLYRDFDAVSQVAGGPYILTVHPSLPVKSVAELVAYAKANPAKLNFASTGNASLAHLAGEHIGGEGQDADPHIGFANPRLERRELVDERRRVGEIEHPDAAGPPGDE